MLNIMQIDLRCWVEDVDCQHHVARKQLIQSKVNDSIDIIWEFTNRATLRFIISKNTFNALKPAFIF